jgi:hypothetical protein
MADSWAGFFPPCGVAEEFSVPCSAVAGKAFVLTPPTRPSILAASIGPDCFYP